MIKFDRLTLPVEGSQKVLNLTLGLNSVLLSSTRIIPTRAYGVLGFFPELVLDFESEKYFTDRRASSFANAITHTRASTATYVDSTGTLQTAAINEPRLGHHVWNGTAWVNEGLLHESEARTNLITYSASVGGTNWLNGVNSATQAITLNSATAPDGTNSATLVELYRAVDTGFTYLTQITGVSAGPHVGSFWVKAKTGADVGKVIAIWQYTPTNSVVNIKNITLTADWVRVNTDAITSLSAHASGEPAAIGFRSGIGSTGNVDFYVWGAQGEAAPTPSSYIPTNSGSTVTRSADVLTIPAANLPYPEPVVIGPELVTNGTFDTNIDGWTAQPNSTASAVSSEAQVTTTSTSGITQTLTTVAGKVYQVTGTIRNSTATDVRLRAVDGSGFISPIIGESAAVSSTSATAVSAVFVALSTQTTIYARVNGVGIGFFDNISVREINPLALSIQMDGRVTYADDGESVTARFINWFKDAATRIEVRLDTFGSNTGAFVFIQEANDVTDLVISGSNAISPDVLVPFSLASRHGSTFLNGATDGTALTADTTPVALPDLSTTNLTLASKYNGTIRTFRMWGQDIGDAGLVEATS